MCIAVPVEVLSVDGFMARVSRGGEVLDVSLVLMSEDVAPGDYVILQAHKYAVRRLDAAQAAEVLALFDEVAPGAVACGPTSQG